MSTIHGTDGLGPATSKRQVYSPLEAYWIAFQDWRKRESQRTQLCRRTDSDIADSQIGAPVSLDPTRVLGCELLTSNAPLCYRR